MLQYLIIAVLVIWSAVVVFKKVFPKTANSAFLSIIRFVEKQGWATLAKWLKPKMTLVVQVAVAAQVKINQLIQFKKLNQLNGNKFSHSCFV